MIHIVTQHFGTNAWLEIQRDYIEKYSPDKDEYKVYILLYKTTIPEGLTLPSNYEIIDLNIDPHIVNDHYLIVESCYDRYIKERIANSDIVVYMDSDAFPIDLWTKKLQNYLSNNHICAVYRYEDRGPQQPDQYFPYPHLCFYSFKKADRERYGFRHELPPGFPCPGFTICDVIRANGLQVKELVRTNKFNNHPTMFGVYDDMIYHQSSGSRAMIGRPHATPGAAPDNSHMCYEGIDAFHRMEVYQNIPNFIERDINEINYKIWTVIFDKIVEDKSLNFLRRFYIGKL